jgi:adenylate cyclase
MERDHLSRKLAVILHADVVGSTLLVQQNESIAHERIQAIFRNFSETIKAYGGIAREIRGDALVAEFDRASDAVTAALAFQVLNEEVNATLDDDIQPQLRVGISMGEVIIADNTITGTGVVLAQRLEQLADSNGVVVQGSVSETVPDRMPFDFESLGEQLLKGFEQPVRAFSVRLQSGEILPEPEQGIPGKTQRAKLSEIDPGSIPDNYESLTGERIELPNRPSIAILPFQNISGDPEQEYFADGLTEDIITALSRVPNIVVIARNSTFVYKGKAVDVRQVGHDLGVGHVLEGSVRKSGDRVRITAQLVSAQSGDHIWAEKYDRSLDDIFAIQDEITHNIVLELQVKLITGQDSRLSAIGTRNTDAWSLVLRAGPLVESHVRDNARSAKKMLKQALDLDQNYAAAWVLLGWVYKGEANWGLSEDVDESMRLAFEAAEHSISSDPNYPDAYCLLGSIYRAKGGMKKSLEMNEKALDLAPNDSAVIVLLGGTLVYSGRVKEGLKNIRKAMRLCPYPPHWYLFFLGIALHLNGDNGKAVNVLEKAIEKEPETHKPRVVLASALFEIGRLDEARAYAETILNIEPSFSADSWAEEHYAEAYSGLRKNLLAIGLPK